MLAETGARFAAGTFRQPEIEPEFALTLAADLDGAADADAVRAATGSMRLAMEIADTRYVARGVHGQAQRPPCSSIRVTCGVTLARDEHAVMVLDGAGWHCAKARFPASSSAPSTS